MPWHGASLMARLSRREARSALPLALRAKMGRCDAWG
jgi:hypothetical protein